MNFPAAIEHGDESTAFGVRFPDVPGCFSAGDTYEEALENAVGALEGHLELLVEDEESLPTPSSIDEHKDNPEYEGCSWEMISIVI